MALPPAAPCVRLRLPPVDDGTGSAHRWCAPIVVDGARRPCQLPGARVDGPGSGTRWQTAAMGADLRVHEGGSGQPLLVLLHGLGATGDVWAGWWPLLARRWPGRCIAPDLPGHGSSPPLDAY